ncbi:MAG: type IV pilus assembly protein PilB [Planctomycetota bacterium]|jgi:type IV pilus assembly protein PilB
MVKISGKIRRLIVDSGLVSSDDWNSVVNTGVPVLSALIEQELVSEAKLLGALGMGAGLPPVELMRVRPDATALEAIPQETCREHCVLPIARNGEILTVAVSDPFDVLLLDDLNILSGCRVRPVISHPAAIRQALETAYDDGRSEVDDLLEEVSTTDIEIHEEDESEDLALSGGGDGVPAVKLVNLILMRALKEKASDIHIEPGDDHLRVRFRVDGKLFQVLTPPKGMLAALTSRLKVMSNLDIAERQVPQDGKFQIKYEGRQIDFRLSTLPVVGGEKAVMRILDQSGVAMRLDALGYEPKCLEDMQTAIAAPYGMVLVTGPTGSGKSTTLYAAVKDVAKPDINVVTVEDPVEYRMDGVNQVPVNPKRGLTFAGALRSILRQDPDVVLVGEIRDKETAEIGVKAALTGHLVLSTLHTNDATQAVTRLVDMGIDPFMVSSSLLCVAAQRLVRNLCPHCRQPVSVPEEELMKVGFLQSELEGLELFGPNPNGCPRCKSGYRGRFALLETLFVTSTLKRMIVQGASASDMKEQAIEDGMLTLRRVGILNAIKGRTSLEEALRVTMADGK